MCLAPHLKWLPWSLEQKPEKFPMRFFITKLVREFAMFVKFIPRRVRRIGGGKNSDANRDAGRLPHDCGRFRGVFFRRAISETRQTRAHSGCLRQNRPNPNTVRSLSAGLPGGCTAWRP